MRVRSKRYMEDVKKVPSKPVPLDEAIRILKSFRSTKFDQTVDLVCCLGIDSRQAEQTVRGSVSLPHGIGKTKKVIAFCPEGEVEAAKKAGAIEAGGDDLIDKIQKGWTDFDVAIAHPSMMGKVGKLGRILGPQGKMPSPKTGTVTPDVVTAVREYSAGKVEFRNDKGGNVHAVVGKMSFPPENLKANIIAFVDHVRRLRPASAKGQFIKKVAISGTMTPSVLVDVSQIGSLE
jgi:large subunit ribosomal protein L1